MHQPGFYFWQLEQENKAGKTKQVELICFFLIFVTLVVVVVVVVVAAVVVVVV